MLLPIIWIDQDSFNFESCRVFAGANCFCTEALKRVNCKVTVIGGVKTSALFRKAVGLLARKDSSFPPKCVVSDGLKRAIIQLGEWPIRKRSEFSGLKNMSR